MTLKERAVRKSENAQEPVRPRRVRLGETKTPRPKVLPTMQVILDEARSPFRFSDFASI